MNNFTDLVEQINRLLDPPNKQCWLFGAGTSCDANIPLMDPLTDLVKKLITESNVDNNQKILDSLEKDLDEKAHIEHYLSHLGDLIALAERSKDKSVSIKNECFIDTDLKQLHSAIIEAIGVTVRYGYKKSQTKEEVGTLEQPIINIEPHRNFIKALFKTTQNLTSRSSITFFTTNYDTLLEDAMALEKLTVVDGFSGGAMGFWNPEKEFPLVSKSADGKNPINTISPKHVFLFKLHGSVDWHRNQEAGLVRARYGTTYLSDLSEIMIYPQATKYVETQKDPFASLFAQFRLSLKSTGILITCGYSFGDEHINAEIELALNNSSSNVTLIAFSKEMPMPDKNIKINKTLDAWLQNSRFGKRVYVAGENGIYNNSLMPINAEIDIPLNWWKFSGLTDFLNTGEIA